MASGYEYGVKYSQASKGNSPPGGWPQVEYIFGREPTYEEMKKDFAEFNPRWQLHIQEANERLTPILGFLPFPDMQTFYRPYNYP